MTSDRCFVCFAPWFEPWVRIWASFGDHLTCAVTRTARYLPRPEAVW